MKLKLLFLAFTLVAPVLTAAQSYRVDTIIESDPNSPSELYYFPMLVGGNSMICDSVNRTIARDLLEIELGSQKVSIFENIWPDSTQSYGRLFLYGTEVMQLNERIYSVKIIAEGCGAYCEGFEDYYSFDLLNGKRIELKKIFNDSGRQKILELLSSFRATEISEQIAYLENELSNPNLNNDDIDFYTDALDLYQSCNTEISSLEYLKFYFSNQSLTIISGRCSAHVNRAIDDLSEFFLEFDFNELMPFLNDYGKSLL